jgi:hypothetical protein
LVEHSLCKAGAKGSNPFISTLLFLFLRRISNGSRSEKNEEVILMLAIASPSGQLVSLLAKQAGRLESRARRRADNFFLGQRTEGLRWRPRHSETMKGAEAGDTLRGVGNKH